MPMQVSADIINEHIKRIPIFKTLDFRVETYAEGFCRATVPYDRKYTGIYGSFHGGLLTTVADSVAAFAILTQTGIDQALTTTDLNVRFLAPCMTDVTCEARVIKLGRTLCPVDVQLFDANAVKVAVAQVTYIRLDKKPQTS
jgi:uncharacterized protein (TIGR00369 family)